MTAVTENQSRIIEILGEIIETKGITKSVLGPGTILEEIGLESLDFAEVVIKMDEITGKDPFSTGNEYDIKTLSDLANLYD